MGYRRRHRLLRNIRRATAKFLFSVLKFVLFTTIMIAVFYGIYAISENTENIKDGFNVAMDKSFGVFCNDSERLYRFECIPIIQCSDGTLAPECSKNKPLKCVDGELIERASDCGCPNRFAVEIVADSCVNRLRPNITKIEHLIHEQVNLERSNKGLSELDYNERIADIARKHSEDMKKRDYFDHESPEGYDFMDRYRQGGFRCSNPNYSGGENIQQGWVYGEITYTNGAETERDWYNEVRIARSTVADWMGSPGHRQNILTPDFQEEGIGVAVGPDGAVYATQNFC